MRQAFVFEKFVGWLLSKDAQSELTIPDRTWRDQIAWCWNVPIPVVLTGEIHHCIIIDGIRVGGQTCLVARTVHYVLAWMWVPYESSEYWSELLTRLPAPTYVVCDGQKGMLKAIDQHWPAIIVQRCRFHVWLNIRVKLTLNPQTAAARQLLELTRTLLHVRTRRQARRWRRALRHWHKKHHRFINERTYKDNPAPRERSWRYTHERIRSAYRQLDKQANDVLRSSY